jgi:hypothetical protein
MKRLLFISFVSLAITASISSCTSFGSGPIIGSASLQANNFSYVSQKAMGKATVTRFMGLGGGARQALAAEAKQNLLKNYPVKDGQALANVTIDYKASYILIISTLTCTVTADIVAFK